MKYTAFSCSLVLLLTAASAQQADYTLVDEIRGSHVGISSFPIRPMAIVPAKDGRPRSVWTVNQHEDLVERFALPSAVLPMDSSPNLSVRAPWNPVSIAFWPGGGSDGELLVASRGSWGVLRLDATTGAILGYITLTPGDLGGAVDSRGHGLMAEPGDLLVDEATNMAFLSCMGADAVVQIDLTQRKVVRRFHFDVADPQSDLAFRAKSPLFLSFEPSGPTGSPRRVFVAPLHSGNGTTIDLGGVVSGALLIDTPAAFNLAPLPDEDLFAITPWSGSSNGSVDVILQSTGTILFAHGVNPQTGAHWQLNTEALNGGPLNSSEPLVNGRFATNRITVTTGLGTGSLTSTILNLEDTGSGAALQPGQGVGQPFALAFGRGGRAYVAGLLSDNIVQLRNNGTFVREWDLPEGAIPRGISPVSISSREHLLIYCWGTNEILLYRPSNGMSSNPLATLRLTQDSTPTGVKRGRELFFDGSRSATGTLSCATCHVEGGFDLLAWDLSPLPFQFKGPMVTQTLIGIEKLGPFHWRGERELTDFNGAFPGLLGNHDPATMGLLTDEEFADFQTFIFSLRNPANPNQNRRRVVDATLHNPGAGPGGNAVAGQMAYRSVPTVGAATCVNCHAFPTGTTSDVFPIFNGNVPPARTNLLPTPLHELWRKEQPVLALGPGPADKRALLGVGLAHSGNAFDLFDFHFFVGDPGDQNNIVDFVHQWDQGLAPAAHFAFEVTPASVASSTATAQAKAYLEAQASALNMNCDVVVIGQTDLGAGVLRQRSWFFDRDTPGGPAYRCEDTSIPDRTFSDFVTAVTASGESHVFIGYPVGSGERIGIDRDMDGITDFDEAAAGTDPYDNTDPGNPIASKPSFVSGVSLLWVNSLHARLAVATDQPTRLTIQHREVGQTAWTTTQPDAGYAKVHAPLIRQLRSRTARSPLATLMTPVDDEDLRYEVQVTAINRTGRRRTSPITQFDASPFNMTSSFLEAGSGDTVLHEQHLIESAQVTRLGANRFRYGAGLRFKRGGPALVAAPTNRIVVARVLRERPGLSGQSVVEQLPLTDLVQGTDSALLPTILIRQPNSMVSVALDTGSNFLVTVVPSDAMGQISMDFGVRPSVLLPGDRLFVTVDAVIEVTPSTWALNVAGAGPVEVPMASARGLSQWSFPDSGEKQTAPGVDIP